MTSDEITAMHSALHVSCGLPALAPTDTDCMAWWAFLREMDPIAQAPGGPFSVADLRAVIAEMQRQRRAGEANWSMRPQKILRDPESFRDLVLIARSKRRANRPTPPRPQQIQQLPGGGQRRLDPTDTPPEPSGDREEIARMFAAARDKILHRRPTP